MSDDDDGSAWHGAIRYVLAIAGISAMALMGSLVSTDTRLEQRIDRVIEALERLQASYAQTVVVETQHTNRLAEHDHLIDLLDQRGGKALWDFKIEVQRRFKEKFGDAGVPGTSSPRETPRPPLLWAGEEWGGIA